MYKKIMVIISVMVLCTINLSIPANQIIGMNNVDELDQQQLLDDGFAWGVWGSNTMLGQSFKPTKNIITRVEIKLMKTGNPQGLEISIRSDLYGNDLTSKLINAAHINNDTNGEWVEFDFPNIYCTLDQTYYIIWRPYGSLNQSNMFFWKLKDDNPYALGNSWIYLNNYFTSIFSDILFV